MAALYPKPAAEAAAAVWLLSLRSGYTASQIMGVQNCPDGCGVDRSRWEIAENDVSPFMRCRVCKRFIGYVMPEKTTRPKKRRKTK